MPRNILLLGGDLQNCSQVHLDAALLQNNDEPDATCVVVRLVLEILAIGEAYYCDRWERQLETRVSVRQAMWEA